MKLDVSGTVAIRRRRLLWREGEKAVSCAFEDGWVIVRAEGGGRVLYECRLSAMPDGGCDRDELELAVAEAMQRVV